MPIIFLAEALYLRNRFQTSKLGLASLKVWLTWLQANTNGSIEQPRKESFPVVWYAFRKPSCSHFICFGVIDQYLIFLMFAYFWTKSNLFVNLNVDFIFVYLLACCMNALVGHENTIFSFIYVIKIWNIDLESIRTKRQTCHVLISTNFQ